MADAPTPEQWADLRRRRPSSEDALALLPVTSDGQQTPLVIAVDDAGNLHLLIPVQRGPTAATPADLNGLRLRHRHLETGQVLDVFSIPSHERAFTPFCRELIDAVLLQGRDPWAAAAATIRAWQSAWRPLRPEMDKTTQVGLYGELWTLERILIPAIGPRAVTLWSGPDSERHDFVGERLHLEVKTTRRGRSEHEVSRIDQLHVPAGRRLLLVSIQVEESLGGAETLATRLDAVSRLLRDDPAALDLFLARMVGMGWSDEMRRSGNLVRLDLRRVAVFAVEGAFPRLPDDFQAPTGVVSVRYTIDLANVPDLAPDEVNRLVADGM
jgi:hypothetical protein